MEVVKLYFVYFKIISTVHVYEHDSILFPPASGNISGNVYMDIWVCLKCVDV